MMTASWCTAARVNDNQTGYKCTVTGGRCMFILPDSRICAKFYNIGPDAEKQDDQETDDRRSANE